MQETPLARLRTATWPLHRQLEATPLLTRMMSPQVTRDDYRRTVAVLYHGVAPLERDAARALGPDWARAWRVRPKTPLLAADLAALGPLNAPHPPRPPIPPGTDAALGVLYVLEGATVGGQLAARHLRTHLGAPVEDALAFYTCYGERTGSQWQQFKTRLNRHWQGRDSALAAAVEAACAAFAALGAAFEHAALGAGWTVPPARTDDREECDSDARR